MSETHIKILMRAAICDKLNNVFVTCLQFYSFNFLATYDDNLKSHVFFQFCIHVSTSLNVEIYSNLNRQFFSSKSLQIIVKVLEYSHEVIARNSFCSI